MKLHSVYLNPFQPFPEREHDNQSEDRPRSAIENNLSRAVFSALANAGDSSGLANFVQALARHGSPALCARTEALAETLRDTDPSNIECDLQTWPAAAMRERESLQVLLIGISSSHDRTWTHDQRPAPSDPRPDAWIYVPGRMLLVFECKNDEHPLDATQISAYAHFLELLTKNNNVPRAQADQFLASIAEAKAVQDACRDLVLDVPWSTVADALLNLQRDNSIAEGGRWLCGQAVDYLQWHIRPPYCGIPTILEWLNGPDTPDRRNHLRTLVRRMGHELEKSAQGRQGAITFVKDKKGDWELLRGAGSPVYVKLQQDGKLLQRELLDREVGAVLWFRFAEHESKRIGLAYYYQASGSQMNGKDDPVAWNRARDRHLNCAEPFERMVAAWMPEAPQGSQVIVSAVRFNGKKKTWQGGGIEDPLAPNSSQTTSQGPLEFLRKYREELWRFPGVGPGEAASTIEEAAPLVRKPALSLRIPLETNALASCGENARALQDYLQNAVARITTKTAHEPRGIEGEQGKQQKG